MDGWKPARAGNIAIRAIDKFPIARHIGIADPPDACSGVRPCLAHPSFVSWHKRDFEHWQTLSVIDLPPTPIFAHASRIEFVLETVGAAIGIQIGFWMFLLVIFMTVCGRFWRNVFCKTARLRLLITENSLNHWSAEQYWSFFHFASA